MKIKKLNYYNYLFYNGPFDDEIFGVFIEFITNDGVYTIVKEHKKVKEIYE